MKIEFLNTDGKFNTALLEDYADKWSRSFVRPPRVKAGNREIPDRKLTAVYLLLFFDELKAIRENFRASGTFEAVIPRLKMLKAKAMYACPATVKNRDIPEVFREFIFALVDAVKTGDDIEYMIIVYEALVGFAYGNGIRE